MTSTVTAVAGHEVGADLEVTVTLNWLDPAPADCQTASSTCNVTSYEMTYDGGEKHERLDAGTTSFTTTADEVGSAAPFYLTATNKYGTGPAGTLSVVLGLPPTAPVVTATSGSASGSVSLSWREVDAIPAVIRASASVFEGTSSRGESSAPLPSSDYTLTFSVDSNGVTHETAKITGLTSGTTYYFQVALTNAAGTGPPSAETRAAAT
jgi:hypothetical protein